MSISASGIEQAIAGLNYRNPSAVKSRLLDVIKQYYDGLESPEMVDVIATDDLVQKMWTLESDPSAIQSKRKNLSSIKSTINADLDRAWREGRNPEGIMIGPDNTFTMSSQAKDKMIAAFSGAASADGVFKMDEVNAALRLVSEFLSSRKDAQMAEELERLTAIIKKVTEETGGSDVSGYDFVKKGENTYPDGEESGEKTTEAGTATTEWMRDDSVAGNSAAPLATVDPEASVLLKDGVAEPEGDAAAPEALSQSIEAPIDSETAGLGEGVSDLAEVLSGMPAPDGIPEEVVDLTDADEISQVEEASNIEEFEVLEEDEIIEDTEEFEVAEEGAMPELPGQDAEIVEESQEVPGQDLDLLDEEALELVEEIEGGFPEADSEMVEETLEESVEEEDFPDEEALELVEEIEEAEEIQGIGKSENVSEEENIIEVPGEIEVAEDDETLELFEEDAEKIEEMLESSLEEEDLLDEEALELVEEIEAGAPEATAQGETQGFGVPVADASGSSLPGGVASLSGRTEGGAGAKGSDGGALGNTGAGESAGMTTDTPAGMDVPASGLDELEDLTDTEALSRIEDIEDIEEIEEIEDIKGAEEIEEFEQIEEVEEIAEVEETAEKDVTQDEIMEDDEEIEVAEDDGIEELLDEDVEILEEVLSDEEIEFVNEEVSDEKEEPDSEIDADDGDDDVDEMVKKLLAPDRADALNQKSPEETENWMQNVGLPVDLFDEDGIDLENLERDTAEKKVLAARFDGFLGVMERYYNQLITIPEGDYVVGGKGDSQDELPLQKYSLSEYYIGKFPVTNAVFEIFIDRTGYVTTAEKLGYGFVYHGRFQKIVDDKTGRSRSVWNPTYTRKRVEGASWFQPLGPGSSLHNKRNHPVVQVSLKDAKSFAAWTGKRLPTEIEWEAAARTKDGRGLPWGEQWQEIVCNAESSGISDTTAVNQYPGGDNPFGVSDLMGNVMEWTNDQCEPKYELEGKTVFYIAKGCGWIADRQVTLSSRSRMPVDFSSNILGFRCVVD